MFPDSLDARRDQVIPAVKDLARDYDLELGQRHHKLPSMVVIVASFGYG